MENNPSPYAAPSSNVFAPSSAVGESITDGVIEQLRGTKGWVKFLGVLCFISAALILLGSIVFIGIGAMGAASMTEATGFSSGLIVGFGVLYALMSVLYIYPGIKLWKYGSGIDRLIQDRSNATLEMVLNEQRAFWKYAGVVIIISIILYIVAIVVMGVVGASFSGSGFFPPSP